LPASPEEFASPFGCAADADTSGNRGVPMPFAASTTARALAPQGSVGPVVLGARRRAARIDGHPHDATSGAQLRAERQRRRPVGDGRWTSARFGRPRSQGPQGLRAPRPPYATVSIARSGATEVK
jgi:hypothetical protein